MNCMKRKLFLLILAFPTLIFGQQSADCSRPGNFTKVQVYDAVVASFEKGDEYKICPGDNTQISDLQIVIEDNTLKIRKIAGKKYDKLPRVVITYKTLEQIEGFGQATLDTRNLIKQESIKILLHSGATFYASFDVKFLEVEMSEGCLLKADGYANYQTINVSTKATFSGFELEGNQGEVKAVTGGTAKINITEKLDAQASTKGTINYKGTPKMESKATLGGVINAYRE
jgi:hypothetical protein